MGNLWEERREHPLTQAATGAIVGAVVWWALNGAVTVNGVGWLARRQLPLGGIGLFIIAGSIISGAAAVRARRRQRAHRQNVETECQRMGFIYQKGADDLLKLYPGAEKLPLFRDWTSAVNRTTGAIGGTTIEVFDLTGRHTSEGPEGSTTTVTRQTVVFLPETGLPDFAIRPKGLTTHAMELVGLNGITFDPGELVGDAAQAVTTFTKLYRVDRVDAMEAPTKNMPCDDVELAIRRVFAPEVMQVLAARPGWSAQSSGGRLALWQASAGALGTFGVNGLFIPIGRGGRFVPAPLRASLIENAVTIFDALKHSQLQPSPLLPARPDSVIAMQRAQRKRRAIGGVAGLFLGFFGGFGLFGALMTSQERGKFRMFMLLAMPVLSIGGAILGALTGAYLGARFLPLSLEYASNSPERSPFSSGWPVVGLFVGFMLGGVLGMAIAFQIGHSRSLSWLVPILFFFGVGAGAAIGMILGSLFARRRGRGAKGAESHSE